MAQCVHRDLPNLWVICFGLIAMRRIAIGGYAARSMRSRRGSLPRAKRHSGGERQKEAENGYGLVENWISLHVGAVWTRNIPREINTNFSVRNRRTFAQLETRTVSASAQPRLAGNAARLNDRPSPQKKARPGGYFNHRDAL
ncbi:MAG: hypothetical protein WBS18_03875 [Candidatus Acidiferrales bacterium]